jgi:hypothetical protein
MKYIKLKRIGIILFCFTALMGCSEDESLTPNESFTGGTSQEQDFGRFTGDIDGAAFEQISTLTNNTIPSAGVSEETDATVSPFISKKDYNFSLENTTSNETGGISIGTVTYSGSQLPPKEDFNAVFSEGNKTYARNFNNGVSVFVNMGGVTWSSSNGTADQTGSTFTITNATPNVVFGADVVEVTATFSCTLYDDSGDSKKITNGTFKGTFESF